MKPYIRQASTADFGTILRMLVDMHGDVGEFPISVEKIGRRLDETLAHGVALIVEIDDKPVGTMGLRGEEPWYSEQRVVADTWIWAAPGRHRLSVFRAMVQEAHNYARVINLPCILTLYSVKNTERKTKLFERVGRQIMEGYQFKPAGGDFRAGAEV